MKAPSSKKFIFITILLTIVAIGVVGYLILDERGLVPENGSGQSSIGSFFPFGGEEEDDNTLINQPDRPDDPEKVVFPRLRKLTDTPTAGAVAFTRGSEVVARYVEKNTGHVYELPMSTDEPTRLINKTVPRIHDALWDRSGRNVIMRYIEDGEVRSFTTPVPDVPVSTAPNSTPLITGLEEALPSKSTSEMLYLYHEDGYTYGIRSNFKNETQEQLFSSPFSEWLLDWPNNNIIVATPKPSYGIINHSYRIDANTNTFVKILGNKPAMISKMNPFGDQLLWSSTGSNGHTFGIYNVSDKKELPLAYPTNPEKCVWGGLSRYMVHCAIPGGFTAAGFPDSWYKGEVSFNDVSLIHINTQTLETESVVLADETTEQIDAIKLFMDPNETYLYFFNKKDMSLWSYQLKLDADLATQNTASLEDLVESDTATTSTVDEVGTATTSEMEDVS